MTRRRFRLRLARGLILAGALFWIASCGVKSKPVPKGRVAPKAPSRLRAEAVPSGVRLRCRLPDRNTDGSFLRNLARVEIWRAEVQRAGCEGCKPLFRKIGEVPAPSIEPERAVKPTVEYTDAGLKPGGYVYRVLAVNDRGVKSGASSKAEIYWNVPPKPVEGLMAFAGEKGVRLFWKPVTERADGRPLAGVVYQVIRGGEKAEEGESALHETPIRDSGYLDTGVATGRIYRYRVRALVREGENWLQGPWSAPLEVAVRDVYPPRPPGGLVAFPTDRGIRLTWQGSDEADIRGYRIYRAVDPAGPWRLLTEKPIRSISYEDLQGERGRLYWYSVTAVDQATPQNESGRSTPVRARFPKSGRGGTNP